MNELLNDTINVHLFERKYFITNKVFCCAVWTKQRLLRNFAKTINKKLQSQTKGEIKQRVQVNSVAFMCVPLAFKSQRYFNYPWYSNSSYTCLDYF